MEDLNSQIADTYKETRPELIKGESVDSSYLELATRQVLGHARMRALHEILQAESIVLAHSPDAVATSEKYHLLDKKPPIINESPYLAVVRTYEKLELPDVYEGPTGLWAAIPSIEITQRFPLKAAQKTLKSLGKGGARSWFEKARWLFRGQYDVMRDKLVFTDGKASEVDSEGQRHIDGGTLTVIRRQLSSTGTEIIPRLDVNFSEIGIEQLDVYLGKERLEQLDELARKYVGEGLERHKQSLARENQALQEAQRLIDELGFDGVEDHLAELERKRREERKKKR